MSGRYAGIAVLLLVCAAPAMAQKAAEKAPGKTAVPSTSAYLDALRKNSTTAGKVALGEAAAPPAIARHATVVEMISPTESKTLRAGTNGWTCIADPNGPICMDETFMAFSGAQMHKLQPNTTRVGIAYMLAGDDGASLTDPYGGKSAPDAVKSGPHMMIIVPDASQLAGLSDDPAKGGPYVMWKGTPYAHMMVPVK